MIDNSSSPDHRLVELECRNGHKCTPILHQKGAQGDATSPGDLDRRTHTSTSAIGAYCGECRIWIKWVPKSEVWLALLAYQKEHPPYRFHEVRASEPARMPTFDVPPDAKVQAWIGSARTYTLEELGMEYVTIQRRRHDFQRQIYSENCVCGLDLGNPVHGSLPPLPDFGSYARMEFASAITQMAAFCHVQSQALGFHDEPRSLGDLIALINTELAELFEALRKGIIDSPSDHIPDFTYREEEWADVGVRWLDHAVENGVDPHRLAQAFVAKLEFNRTRGYRHGGKTI